MSQKTAIVAVLNWGLGHATRCVPLIGKLNERSWKPVLASDGVALAYLRHRFPALDSVELPAYDIRYRHNSMFLNMLLQSGKMRRAIRAERKQIDTLARQTGARVVLSDNRYGCYSRDARSILLTHQLRFPALPKWMRMAAEQWLSLRIGKFDEVWLPDGYESVLSGRLTDRSGIGRRFLGTLSRIEKPCKKERERYGILALVSGPDPLRGEFAARVARLLSTFEGRHCILRGSGRDPTFPFPSNCDVYSFADGDDLQQLVCASGTVLCRSGYSTLMDLGVWGKPAVVVPTPSQPEQEYLGRRMEEKEWAVCLPEWALDRDDLVAAVEKAKGRRVPDLRNEELLEDAVASL